MSIDREAAMRPFLGVALDQRLQRALGAVWIEQWVAMAERGCCDSLGSMEYQRVTSEWIAAGMPLSMENYIYRRANIDANGKEPD